MGKGSWEREGGKVMSGKKSKVGFNILLKICHLILNVTVPLPVESFFVQMS
jgi:hypothetical protein